MKARKILVSLAALALVAAISIGGTLAYLTSTKTVTNTFTVGDVKITLDEAKVNQDGTYVNGHDNRTEDTAGAGNSYLLLPGHNYMKDPTVTVLANSEDCYVRMKVTITKADQLKAIFGEDFLPQNYVQGWEPANWSCKSMTYNETDKTFELEFRYKEIVKKNTGAQKLDDLFESFTVPGTISNDDLAKLDGMEIKVVAEAIQADGFVETTDNGVVTSAEDNAWAKF